MSMNLIIRNDNQADDTAAVNWSAIKVAAQNDHGMVTIDDETVKSVARLVDGVILTNGERVCAYAYDDEDDFYATYVSAFGPSLLPTKVQDEVRDRLATADNGKIAVKLFNEIIRLGLQIGLHGTETCPAYIKGVNWVADEVEINRSSGNMCHMLEMLGLGDAVDTQEGTGEVSFDRFLQAVNDNAYQTDMPDRLQALVASGQRRNATHVYWC